jgi:hypothetical protein
LRNTHLAWGGGQILAQRETAGIDLPGPAVVVQHVVDHVAQPLDHAGATGLEGALERGRVGEQVVGRRQRVHRQPGHQPGLGLLSGLQPGYRHQPIH